MNAVTPFTVEREFQRVSTAYPADLIGEVERLREALATIGETTRIEAEAAALERLREERDSALLASCDKLRAALEFLDEHFATAERQLADDAAELALDAAERIAGQAIERDVIAGIDQAIGRALAELRRGSPIEARVHPDLVAPLEAAIDARQTRDRRQLTLTVIADPSLQPGDARLRWERGEALLSAAGRRASLATEFAELVAR